jgi:predicted dehydrogenase
VWTEADRAARVNQGTPGVFLQLNDDNAFDPKYKVLHDLIARGVIGKVQHLSMIRGSTLDATSVLQSQASALDNGGGCLMDYGSHGLAGAWYALGTQFRPTLVEAVRIRVLFPHRVLEGEPYLVEVDDNAQIKVRFEDPETGSWITVFLEATWTGGHIGLDREKPGGQSNGYLRIIGDEGIIHSASADQITVRRWDGGESVLPLREYPGESISFDDEVGGFLAGIRAGVPPEIDVHFGAEVIAICGAAYLSALRRQSVTLDEFRDYAQGYVAKYGDNEHADDALIMDLLAPYRRKNG